MAITRRTALLLGALTLGACSSLDVDVPVIPEGSIQYVMEPSLLFYDFTDSSGASRLRLRWLADMPYAGTNCFALSPNTPTDTAGTFVFAFFGSNTGLMWQDDHGIQDTVIGRFLLGQEGTHGTFAVRSNGALDLHWADGSQQRYFHPAATIRLSSDTIYSDIVQHTNADSVKVEWRVRWIRGTC